MRHLLFGTGLFCLLLLSACSSIPPAQHYGGVKLETYKSAYVVIDPRGNPNVASYIVTALAHHNLKVNSGAVADKPADTGFYVTYQDHWNWDVAVYLDRLDVQFMDNTNGLMIAYGSFRNSKIWESWPSPHDKTIEVVDSIFAK